MAATEMEIQPFLDSNAGVDVLISGVGSPSTIYQLTKKLHEHRYDLVLQAGIGGRFPHSTIELSACALISSDLFADLGVQENKAFYSLSDLKFTNANQPPYSSGELVNHNTFLEKSTLPKLKGVTVNKISDDPLQTDLFASKYFADVESMEGAALHYVSILEGIQFLQLRSISNDVGIRDKNKWRIRDAITNLNQHLVTIVENLKSI